MPTTSSEHSTPTSAKVKRNPSSVSRKSNGDSYNLSNGKTSPLKPKSKPCCSQYHLNSVWSIWYCLVSLGFMAYLVYNGVKRFLLYASLPWPQGRCPSCEGRGGGEERRRGGCDNDRKAIGRRMREGKEHLLTTEDRWNVVMIGKG